MKKYIIVVDGEESTKYTYNLWETFEREDGTLLQDSRAVEDDDLECFLEEVRSVIQKE